MMWVKVPDLPQSRVTGVLLAGNVPEIRRELEENYHIEVVSLPKGRRFRSEVGWHADVLCHYAGDGKIFVSPQITLPQKKGLQRISIAEEPQEPYPGDVLLNGARVGKRLFCRVESTAQEVLEDCERRGVRICPVRQGYGKCSVVVVSEEAILTADPSIEKAARQEGLDVLKISPGGIRLDGFPYGFLGGCVGRLAPDALAFTGEIAWHPDGESIRAFLRNYGIDTVALCKGELWDIGGILPWEEVGF